MRCRFFCLKKFLLKKVAAHFPLEKHGESAKGTGRELGKGKGTEKHSTSYTLKKRNKKNTAFSITPGKGNWKNSAFSITPGKGNGKTMKNTAFSITPGKGFWKNTAVASTAGMGTGKAQHVGGPSRHGQLKWVLSSTIMAISCDDLFFEKRQVSCQCKEMEEIKLLRDTWWVSSSTFVAL